MLVMEVLIPLDFNASLIEPLLPQTSRSREYLISINDNLLRLMKENGLMGFDVYSVQGLQG